MIFGPHIKNHTRELPQPRKTLAQKATRIIVRVCAPILLVVLGVVAFFAWLRSLPSWPDLRLPNREATESDRAMSGIVDKILAEGRMKANELQAHGEHYEALLTLRNAADDAIRQLQAYAPGAWSDHARSRLSTFSIDLSNSIAEPIAHEATEAAIADDWDRALLCLDVLNGLTPTSGKRREVETMIVLHLHRLEQTKHPKANALRERFVELQKQPSATSTSERPASLARSGH